MIVMRGRMMSTRSKYHNIKVELDGVRFDSKKEAQRYQELLIMEKANLIVNLTIHPEFKIEMNKHKICKYIADFSYLQYNIPNDTKFIVEDVKGVKTSVYRLKKKLMLACLGIEIREI